MKREYPPPGRLFGELVDAFHGPILVIGGGPSAAADLRELARMRFAPCAVISANEHGMHQDLFRVTHVVCADGVHHAKRRRMESYLEEIARAKGVRRPPIVSPAFFADYRLADWRCAANSGLIAIAIALGMGGSPVVVTGLDFFRWKHPGAATYFHDPDAESSSNRKYPINFVNQIQALHARIGAQQPVRPMSGPLLEHYHRYNPLEVTPAATIFEYARFCYRMPTHIVRAHGSIHWPLDGMGVDHGREVPVSPLEARAAENARQAIPVHVIPSKFERDRQRGLLQGRRVTA